MRQLAFFVLTLAFCLEASSSVDSTVDTNRPARSAVPPEGLQPAAQSQQPPERQRDHGPAQGPNRPWTRQEWEQRRQELHQLPPEQRHQRIREWRRERILHWPEARDLTPEEVRQKREQLRARLDDHISELRQKQASGTLTPQEVHRLGRLEELQRRFQGNSAGSHQPIDESPRTNSQRLPNR